MLSTRPIDGKVRRAENAFPQSDGSLVSRPGAQQVVADGVVHVIAWGERLLFERAGRLCLWDGVVHDLRPAGRTLHGAAFQALTADAKRENRFYLADGVHGLSYVVREGDGYALHDVVNTVLDASGAPYPIPVPVVLATWRGRLWLATAGSNRIVHCELEDPETWDPLWSLEFQTRAPDRVTALLSAGESLLVALQTSLWAVTGFSQYDWSWSAVNETAGCVGPHALTGDGVRAWMLSDGGLLAVGSPTPLSLDVQDLWDSAVSGQLAWDAQRRVLLTHVNGRLLVYSVDGGGWGEVEEGAAGVWSSVSRVGWYGQAGIWALGLRNTPDVDVDGTAAPVRTVIAGWPQQLARRGNGRALLNRVWLTMRGTPGGTVIYTPVVDQVDGPAHTLTLYDTATPTWAEAATAQPVTWPLPDVLREVVPRLSGRTFLHRLETEGYLELVGWEFEVRGT